MGSLRVRPDGGTSLSLFTFMHWRRKLQPTPVFLLGESQGKGSLVGWDGEPGDAAAAAAVQHYKQFGDDKYSGAVGNEL